MGSDGTIAAGLRAGDPGRGKFMIDSAPRPGKAAGR